MCMQSTKPGVQERMDVVFIHLCTSCQTCTHVSCFSDNLGWPEEGESDRTWVWWSSSKRQAEKRQVGLYIGYVYITCVCEHVSTVSVCAYVSVWVLYCVWVCVRVYVYNMCVCVSVSVCMWVWVCVWYVYRGMLQFCLCIHCTCAVIMNVFSMSSVQCTLDGQYPAHLCTCMYVCVYWCVAWMCVQSIAHGLLLAHSHLLQNSCRIGQNDSHLQLHENTTRTSSDPNGT